MADVFNIDQHFDQGILAGSSCAFGVFDGVHTGHQFLLNAACETAKRNGGASIALTFDIDPDELFHADRLKKLQANEDRIARLAASGVDAVCVLPFTREFAAASPKEFLNTTFGGHAPAYLHVGSDFRFGAKAAGNVEDLELWAESTGTHICAHSLVSAEGQPITATRIRKLLLAGEIEEANALLGYPYTLIDVVKPGRGEGADLGFATANLEIAANKRVLAEGVYGARARIADTLYRAAVSVGVSPLFEAQSSANVEVHVLDFAGDLYGSRIEVEFIARIRPMIQFNSVEELVAEVLRNIEWVRNNISLDE